jgi:hypothetical protein
MNRFSFVAAWALLLSPACVMGQVYMRTEDHFWRKRLVQRIPLQEKLNKSLVARESGFSSPSGRFTQTQGMVASLIDGLKTGAYRAYDPDDWSRVWNYEDLIRRMQEFDQAMLGEDPDADPWESGAEGSSGDAWASSEDDGWVMPEAPAASVVADAVVPAVYVPDYGPYEQVIHLVEDWTFDKVRSMMVQQPDFFEVIWVDPTGSLPEKVLARFMWKDVKPQLDKTMWKTRFNDAEARSVAEVFELRLFRGFIINAGGEPVRSLAEAEKRRQEIIEFEHHLWSY